MKIDLHKILVSTSYVKAVAEELEYDHLGNLEQLLDEVDTLAVNTLEDE